MAAIAPATHLSQKTPDELAAILDDTLDALLEFTGATAGWIGLIGPDECLSFPARRGALPGQWLALQQGRGGVWGFEVHAEPTLLNDLPALAFLGEPALHSSLSCPVFQA